MSARVNVYRFQIMFPVVHETKSIGLVCCLGPARRIPDLCESLHSARTQHAQAREVDVTVHSRISMLEIWACLKTAVFETRSFREFARMPYSVCGRF